MLFVVLLVNCSLCVCVVCCFLFVIHCSVCVVWCLLLIVYCVWLGVVHVFLVALC